MASSKQILRKIGKNFKLIEEAEIKRIKFELSENVEDSSLDFSCPDLDFASSKRLLDEAMHLRTVVCTSPSNIMAQIIPISAKILLNKHLWKPYFKSF